MIASIKKKGLSGENSARTRRELDMGTSNSKRQDEEYRGPWIVNPETSNVLAIIERSPKSASIYLALVDIAKNTPLQKATSACDREDLALYLLRWTLYGSKHHGLKTIEARMAFLENAIKSKRFHFFMSRDDAFQLASNQRDEPVVFLDASTPGNVVTVQRKSSPSNEVSIGVTNINELGGFERSKLKL